MYIPLVLLVHCPPVSFLNYWHCYFWTMNGWPCHLLLYSQSQLFDRYCLCSLSFPRDLSWRVPNHFLHFYAQHCKNEEEIICSLLLWFWQKKQYAIQGDKHCPFMLFRYIFRFKINRRTSSVVFGVSTTWKKQHKLQPERGQPVWGSQWGEQDRLRLNAVTKRMRK